MLDASPTVFQRSHGDARVRLVAGPSGTRLAGLRQAGSAKAFLPRVHTDAPEVVFLNTAGGLTGGDRLSLTLDLGPGARAVAATQTAERIYRSAGGAARVGIALTVGPGGHLDWLPQETILFDGAALDRETTLALRGDATALSVETLVFGRHAMGETLRHGTLRDRREVTRDGVPVMIEPLALDGATLAGAHPALLDRARAIATLALFSPDAADRLAGVRARLGGLGVASAWAGRLVVRLAAAEAAPLRRKLAELVTYLRGAPLPRVWQV